jgi:hypothetical protein
MKVNFDSNTSRWFTKQKDCATKQTTVCQCEKCELFYKPSLGHKCKRGAENE